MVIIDILTLSKLRRIKPDVRVQRKCHPVTSSSLNVSFLITQVDFILLLVLFASVLTLIIFVDITIKVFPLVLETSSAKKLKLLHVILKRQHVKMHMLKKVTGMYSFKANVIQD